MSIQYSVPRSELGTGTSLVWFLNNLGGSIVVSALAVYQRSVFTSLAPSGPQPAPTDPNFLRWVLQTQSAVANSIQHVWWAIVPVAVAGLLFAFLVSGRLPAGVGTDPSPPGPTGPM
jgi:hypothetical protein